MSSPGQPLHEGIRERLSGPRLARYEQAAGDVDAAIELYLWNARIGAPLSRASQGGAQSGNR